MSESAIVDIVLGVLALLSVVTTALSAVMVAKFQGVRRDLATVKNEVKNDHETNLRVEQDERHDESQEKLDQIVKSVKWLVYMTRSNRDDITDLQEHTGQGETRRSRRLARQRPPIQPSDIPGDTP